MTMTVIFNHRSRHHYRRNDGMIAIIIIARMAQAKAIVVDIVAVAAVTAFYRAVRIGSGSCRPGRAVAGPCHGPIVPWP